MGNLKKATAILSYTSANLRHSRIGNSMKNMTILGSGRQFSSLDSYSYEFSEASGFKRIMLKLDSNQLSSSYRGNPEVFTGKFPMWAGSGWAMNIRLGNSIFKELKAKLVGSFVHYTTFGLPILSDNEEDVVTIHDLFFLHAGDEAYRRVGNISKKFLDRFKNFKNVVAPSQYIKSELESYGFNGQIKVIYIPVPEQIKFLNSKDECRRKLGLPLDKKLVLSVSSNLKRKNLPTVRETLDRLGPEYSLVRVGPPLGECYTFSSIPPEEMNLIYNASDVLLFPTLMEGFGKPLIEAFAAGLPVVASNIDVIEEVSGNSAILVEPNSDHCVPAIKESLERSEELRKSGLERAKDFSKENFKKSVVQYYDRILKN